MTCACDLINLAGLAGRLGSDPLALVSNLTNPPRAMLTIEKPYFEAVLTLHAGTKNRTDLDSSERLTIGPGPGDSAFTAGR